MDNNLKDFYDEEHDKKMSDNKQGHNGDNEVSRVDHWLSHPYGSGGSGGGGASGRQSLVNKPLWVTITAVCLVLALILGFIIGVTVNEFDDEMSILSSVLETLRSDYYFDISQEEWDKLIADGGTALLQGVDKYGFLLSPQQAYDLLEGGGTNYSDQSYGFSSQLLDDVGLFVHSVADESNAMARLMPNDLIIKLSKSSASLALSQATQAQFNDFLNTDETITFSFIREGELKTTSFARGKVGSANNDLDKFQYVQYYFSDYYTNVSISNESGRVTNIKQARSLGNLPSGTGYIALKEFSDTAYDEFHTALGIYADSGCSKLILDLKGNPGGDVGITIDIAGLLTTSSFIEKSVSDSLTNKAGELRITSLRDREDRQNQYYVKGQYEQYFDEKIDDKANIAVWTDGGSASASELLTGTLRDYNTAVHMGTKTYGKGIAQRIVALTNHSGKIIDWSGKQQEYNWHLYYTFAKYYSPLDTNIHGEGYTPQTQYNNLTTYDALMQAVESYWR